MARQEPVGTLVPGPLPPQGRIRSVGADTSVYADDYGELITGEAVALDLRPTALLLRAAGAAIDFLIYFGAFFLLTSLLAGFGARAIDDAALAALSIILLVICIIAAPITVEVATRGRSVGRIVVGARVVRDDGGAIGFRHAFVRALTGVLEIYSTLGGLALLIALLNGRSKRMGDLLAGTYAQQERVARVVRPVFGVPAPLVGWAGTADVARLPDGLARRIAQFLSQAPRLTPPSRARLARDLANEAAPWVSPLPDADPELFLAAVAAVRRQRESDALDLERQRLGRLTPALTATPNDFPDRG